MPEWAPTHDRRFVQQLLSEVRSILKAAVESVNMQSTVEWTDMRWDAIDVSAKWPQGESYRNVHGWVGDGWPVFTLRFEGAAWEDDEQNLRRRVVFFTGPTATIKVLEGGAVQPKFETPHRDAIVKEVRALTERLQKVQLSEVPWQFDLSRRPEQSTVPGSRAQRGNDDPKA
jgi:hypothetical protein